MAWSICKVFIDLTKVPTLTIAPKIRVLSFIHVKMGAIMLNSEGEFLYLTVIEPNEPFIIKVSGHSKRGQGVANFWPRTLPFGFPEAFGLSALQGPSGRYP
jgi:hypothetical protein